MSPNFDHEEQFIRPKIIRMLEPMSKRENKTHKNGHGIETWNCEDCKKEMNNITTKNIKKKVCEDCYKKRINKKQCERYHRLKNKNKLNMKKQGIKFIATKL